MLEDILDFLQQIKDDGGDFFIGAEAPPARMASFLRDYNAAYSPAITAGSDGIVVLQDDVNKWGLELRLYVPVTPPPVIRPLFERNRTYKPEYTYRLNDNGIIERLFARGCRIGIN